MSRLKNDRWRRRAKARSGRLRTLVERALVDADPIRLLAMGAPEDEYDPELDTILPRLRSVKSAAEVRAILHEEFTHWFGAQTAGPPEKYAAAAAAVWAQLEKGGRVRRS